MEREYILNHIEELSAQQLFDAVNQGIVTLEDLRETGNLDATKRRAIASLKKQIDDEDDNAWNTARYTEQGCREYLVKYPIGLHILDARLQIDNLEKQRNQESKEKNKIIEKILRNPNSFKPKAIQKYLKDAIITKGDLINAGIPESIISYLSIDNISNPEPKLGITPDFIPEGYTEVYFWGIPGSGKTCALAAILSTAQKLGYLEIASGPGFDYMLQLKNIFTNNISVLPGPSPEDTTQYLPFTLKKPNERFSRSVSLIELSGEIFQCFLRKNAGKELKDDHEKTFNSLSRFLNGNNRKIHFFFIDYNEGNKLDQEGYTQSDYLNAAASFFNDRNNNFFKKSTEAIYIVLTKSDLMPCDKDERVSQVKEHLMNNNFLAFVNVLRSRCRENSINGNKILGTPFALGNVYFNDLCEFDSESAENIIDILMRRIKPQKQSVLDVFNQ
jgi:hypothetical protein